MRNCWGGGGTGDHGRPPPSGPPAVAAPDSLGTPVPPCLQHTKATARQLRLLKPAERLQRHKEHKEDGNKGSKVRRPGTLVSVFSVFPLCSLCLCGESFVL